MCLCQFFEGKIYGIVLFVQFSLMCYKMTDGGDVVSTAAKIDFLFV